MSGVRRVIAGVNGSPGSLQALRYAASMARLHQADLIPVLAWTPPGGELADRRQPSPVLRRLWAEIARQRLRSAVELALGGVPADLRFESLALRGEPGPVLVGIATGPRDVLVVGAGRRGAWRPLASRVSRYCVAHAQCPVVAVPPSALAKFGHGLRGWALRHRALKLEDARLRVD